MPIIEKAITKEMVEEKINELTGENPQLASVVETIHEMDLKETVNAILVADALEVLFKVHAMREGGRGKALSAELTQHIVKELKPKHPVFAAVLEKAHEMDLKQTLGALVVVEAIKKFLRAHAAQLATT